LRKQPIIFDKAVVIGAGSSTD